MTTSFSLATLVGALEAAGEFIGPLNWEASNREQRRLLKRYGRYAESIKHMPSLKSWAKRTAEEINAILAENGFDIRLNSWGNDPTKFGTVSINDIFVEWPESGDETQLHVGDVSYPAFSSKRFEILWVEGSEEPIIKLSTKGDETVFICVAPDPGGQFKLIKAVEKLRKKPMRAGKKIDRVIIPMVKLDQKPDLKWLVDPENGALHSGPWYIEQALQQVKFGMNQHGARAKEATALGVVFRGAGPRLEIYRVDRPFLVWMEHPKVDVPIFQAHITEEDWKDPGDLSSL